MVHEAYTEMQEELMGSREMSSANTKFDDSGDARWVISNSTCRHHVVLISFIVKIQCFSVPTGQIPQVTVQSIHATSSWMTPQRK